MKLHRRHRPPASAQGPCSSFASWPRRCCLAPAPCRCPTSRCAPQHLRPGAATWPAVASRRADRRSAGRWHAVERPGRAGRHAHPVPADVQRRRRPAAAPLRPRPLEHDRRRSCWTQRLRAGAWPPPARCSSLAVVWRRWSCAPSWMPSTHEFSSPPGQRGVLVSLRVTVPARHGARPPSACSASAASWCASPRPAPTRAGAAQRAARSQRRGWCAS
jgi:hypothetical protein